MEDLKEKSKKQKVGTEAPTAPVKTETLAIGRYLKISPTKVRDLTRLIRGKRVSEAETILKFSRLKGGAVALKVLHSAVANAGAGFNPEEWVVAESLANKGPLFRRRIDPKSRGSRGLITTPSTHLKIVLRKTAGKNERNKNGSQA